MTDPATFTRVPYTAEGVVNDNGINIRTQPFIQNSISLAKVNKGMKVSITGKVTADGDPPNWYELNFDHRTAYIAANFVNDSTPVVSPLQPTSEEAILLPVPWFSQVDSRHFEACGPTSVLMLLQAYHRGTVHSLDDISHFITITQTTAQPALIDAAQKAGPLVLELLHVTPDSMEDTLTSYLSEGKPVILLIDYCKLRERPFHPARYLKPNVPSVHHWWVVVGKDGDNFVINDPLWQSSDNHPNGGKYLHISVDDLKRACANAILVPNESLPTQPSI